VIENRLWFEGYFQSPCSSPRLIPVSQVGLDAEEESARYTLLTTRLT